MSDVQFATANTAAQFKPTAPLPTKHTGKEKYYFCGIPNVSIHRTDGKRIGFVFQVYKTDIEADIKFLDAEIAEGHPDIRYATDEEIRNYEFHRDPRGTMKKEVAADLEKELTETITKKILGQLGISEEDFKDNSLENIQGVDGNTMLSQKLTEMKDKAIQGAGVKITPTGPLMAAQAPTLKGIVGSSTIAEGAKTSGK